MIPTIPFDSILSFAIGAWFAIAAADDLAARRPPVVGVYLGYALFFAALCFAPLGLFLFWAYPDWSLMYLGSVTGPPSVAARFGVVALYAGMGAGGYALAHVLIRGQRRAAAQAVLAASLVLLGVLSLWGLQRLAHVGDREAFEAGSAPWLWQDPLAALLAAAGPLFACTILFLTWRVRSIARAAATTAIAR